MSILVEANTRNNFLACVTCIHVKRWTNDPLKWLILNGIDGLDALMFAGGIEENEPIGLR
ncbi:MAG: hypothetical protein Q8L87_19075 [Anaerolineales bacterium]|jgi:acetate kinase|nr:hypothetical protein [Anaerolineales bacterium]